MIILILYGDMSELFCSLWEYMGGGLCGAPQNYVGNCKNVVNVSVMSYADKNAFALKCGARSVNAGIHAQG